MKMKVITVAMCACLWVSAGMRKHKPAVSRLQALMISQPWLVSPEYRGVLESHVREREEQQATLTKGVNGPYSRPGKHEVHQIEPP